jgi:hypothetical protein
MKTEQQEIAEGRRTIVRVRSKYGGVGKIHVIGRGRTAYVWLGDPDGGYLGSIVGPAALRQLRDGLNRAPGEDQT